MEILESVGIFCYLHWQEKKIFIHHLLYEQKICIYIFLLIVSVYRNISLIFASTSKNLSVAKLFIAPITIFIVLVLDSTNICRLPLRSSLNTYLLFALCRVLDENRTKLSDVIYSIISLYLFIGISY